MDFDFDEEQYSYRDAVRDAFGRSVTPGSVREVWSQGHAYDGSHGRVLAQLDLWGMLVEERFGGSGASVLDLALPLEECGQFAVAEPIVETLVVAPLLLQEWCPDFPGAETLLTGIASGEFVVAVAMDGASLVSDGARADALIVIDRDEIHLLRTGQFLAAPVAGIDPSRRLARCEFVLDQSTLVTDSPTIAARARAAVMAGNAALAVGVAGRMCEMTRNYLLQRVQFGRVLGSFQALKHRLADVAVAVEAARSLTWNALYRVSTSDSGAELAATAAKSASNEALAIAGRASLQLHGGVGFTWEHDLHLWLQRGKALEIANGSASEHRQAIGSLILDEVDSA
ncbi:acyl-CoA dehydrogenase family protein [Frigoribacterium sp. UYMn621]|uniref:acyl-CoA dehydrogenase family protein n=1 Tax=Frigoribacterium sp. UYMn621 TaxID=3156343 RepID=UPI0033954EB0